MRIIYMLNNTKIVIIIILFIGILFYFSYVGNSTSILEGLTNDTSIDATASQSIDNYNHYTGQFNALDGIGVVYISSDNLEATIITNADGTPAIKIYLPNQDKSILLVATGATAAETTTGDMPQNQMATVKSFTGPNGITATIVTLATGKKALVVSGGSLEKPIMYYSSEEYVPNQMNADAGAYYVGATGSTTIPSDTSTGNPANPSGSAQDQATDAYLSSLPKGIPSSQIPAGQEDLYILKTEIVPPPPCKQCKGGDALLYALAKKKSETSDDNAFGTSDGCNGVTGCPIYPGAKPNYSYIEQNSCSSILNAPVGPSSDPEPYLQAFNF